MGCVLLLLGVLALTGCSAGVRQPKPSTAKEPTATVELPSEEETDGADSTDPNAKPALTGTDESNAIAREVARQFGGIAHDIKVRRVDDIIEPDCLSPTGNAYAAGYRVSLRLADSPVELKVIVLSLLQLQESLNPNQYTLQSMPSGSRLTPQQFEAVLHEYSRGSGRKMAIAVSRLDDPLSYGLEEPYLSDGRSWPASQCYAVAWSIGPEGTDGHLNAEVRNDVVWLDPVSGDTKYLGRYVSHW